MTTNETTTVTPVDAGCWVDGHWGQYGPARVIEVAGDYGFDHPKAASLASRHVASMGPSDSPDLTDDEYEAMQWASEEAESYLNEHVAPEGYAFGWQDGEFFLQSEEWWSE